LLGTEVPFRRLNKSNWFLSENRRRLPKKCTTFHFLKNPQTSKCMYAIVIMGPGWT